jgi:hypothetical protein
MAKQSVTFKPRGFKFGSARIANAAGTTAQAVAAAGADDSIIDSIIISSTDTNPQDVQIIVNDGTNDNIIDTVNVPAGSGTDGTHPAVDGLSNAALPLNAQNKKVLFLKAGCTLKAAMVAAVTAAKLVTVNAFAEDF